MAIGPAEATGPAVRSTRVGRLLPSSVGQGAPASASGLVAAQAAGVSGSGGSGSSAASAAYPVSYTHLTLPTICSV
eukprot:6324607-Alexandrium_andersonii.AAC.1